MDSPDSKVSVATAIEAIQTLLSQIAVARPSQLLLNGAVRQVAPVLVELLYAQTQLRGAKAFEDAGDLQMAKMLTAEAINAINRIS